MTTIIKHENTEKTHIVDTLPHEPATAADPDYSGITFEQAKVGNVGGGTIFGVFQTAMSNEEYAALIFQELRNLKEKPPVEVTLDTPDPVPNFKPIKPFPFKVLGYQLPRYPDGVAMQWWDMREAYKNDPAFMERHIAQRTQPGRHFIEANHNVGVGVEMDIIDAQAKGTTQYRENHKIAFRYHSQLLPVTQATAPDYFEKTYGSWDKNSPHYKDSTGYLCDLQREAVNTADINFISTVPETEATIKAVVEAGWMTQEEAEKKFLTVPIPIDTNKFKPDDEKGSRRSAQIDAFNRLAPEGMKLDKNKGYIGGFSRRDHEKDIWGLVKAYGMFGLKNPEGFKQLQDLLIVGGPTNKPGVAEREEDMWKFIAGLPNEIKDKMHILSTPLPHTDFGNILAVQFSPSSEESYNISAIQTRLSKGLTVLSDWAGGHKGTNTPDSTVWFHPLSMDTDLNNWTSYEAGFEASILLGQYDNLVKAGRQSEITPEMQQIADIRENGYQHAMTNFSQEAVLRNMYVELNKRFDGFFE